MKGRRALVAGCTGITGGNLARHLAAQGWEVYGLARRPEAGLGNLSGILPVQADLLDPATLQAALAPLAPTDVFFCTWLRQPSEEENVRVNGAMVRNLFDALAPGTRLRHAALITGTKQYLGPFEAYGQAGAETPFREDTPRLPGLNFYYTQEDILFDAAERGGFSWSVHRPHSIVGFALGNAMNMGSRLLCMRRSAARQGSRLSFPARTSSGTA